jgi:hypothetical protein
VVQPLRGFWTSTSCIKGSREKCASTVGNHRQLNSIPQLHSSWSSKGRNTNASTSFVLLPSDAVTEQLYLPGSNFISLQQLLIFQQLEVYNFIIWCTTLFYVYTYTYTILSVNTVTCASEFPPLACRSRQCCTVHDLNGQRHKVQKSTDQRIPLHIRIARKAW